jgi:hypothetical protein
LLEGKAANHRSVKDKTMDMREKLRKLISDYLEIDVSRVTDEAYISDDLGLARLARAVDNDRR